MNRVNAAGTLPLPKSVVPDPIARVIDQHGALRVLTVATVALLRPRRRPPRGIEHLNDHQLRDIGLPARPPPGPRL